MPVRKLTTIYILSSSYQYNYFLQTVFGYVEFAMQIQPFLSKRETYERERERERERDRQTDRQTYRQTKNGQRERERVRKRREMNMPPHFLTVTLISGNSSFTCSVL